MGSTFLVLIVQIGGLFQNFCNTFQDKGNSNTNRLLRCLEVAKWEDNY